MQVRPAGPWSAGGPLHLPGVKKNGKRGLLFWPSNLDTYRRGNRDDCFGFLRKDIFQTGHGKAFKLCLGSSCSHVLVVFSEAGLRSPLKSTRSADKGLAVTWTASRSRKDHVPVHGESILMVFTYGTRRLS